MSSVSEKKINFHCHTDVTNNTSKEKVANHYSANIIFIIWTPVWSKTKG